jgi:PGF-CTERM protein
MPSASPPSRRRARGPRRRGFVVFVTVAVLVATFTATVPGAGVARADSGAGATAEPSPVPSGVGAPAAAVRAPHNDTGGNLSVLAGPPESYDAIETFGDVATAHRSGALTPAEEVQVGETLVVAARSARLGAEYADTTGPNASVRFFESLTARNVSLTVTRPTPCGRLRVQLRESRTTVFADAEAGEFRLLVDTEGLATTGGCDESTAAPGRYNATLERPTADGPARSTVLFRLDDPVSDPSPPQADLPVRRGPPPVAGTLDTAAAIRRAVAADRLTGADIAVPGEVAVVSVESARLDRAYANATGRNATVRLLRAVNATGGRLRLAPRTGGREVPDGGQRSGLVLPGPGVHTVPDRGNDTFHLVVDTGRARVHEGNGTVALSSVERADISPELIVPGATPDRFAGRLVFGEARAVLEAAPNGSVRPSDDFALAGTDGGLVAYVGSNFAPGTDLALAVRADGRTLARQSVRADSAGRPRPDDSVDARFDLGEQPAGRELTLVLTRNGTAAARTDVLVGQYPTLRDVTLRRVATGPESVTVRFAATARFPAPGYVVVRNRSGVYDGPRVPAREPTRVTGTVQLRPQEDDEPGSLRLIAVYDSNRNGAFDGPDGDDEFDQPFPLPDGDLTRSVELPPPTPTRTVTAPPPGTTLPVTEDGPGFGVLGALLALCGGFGLLVRRRTGPC